MVALLDGAEREHASPLEPTDDHHPAALGQGLGGMLGLVAPPTTVKYDASCSRRPDTATRNMREGPGEPGPDPALTSGRALRERAGQ
jgi:hypothetical protein